MSFYVYLGNHDCIIQQVPAMNLIEYFLIVAVLAILMKSMDDKIHAFPAPWRSGANSVRPGSHL
jgi:hypothetical protein